MIAIAENPRINQQVAAKLARLGVTLVPQEEEQRVVAQLPEPLYLDQSGTIFRELNRLGLKGYDKGSLHIGTVEGVVNVSFALNN